MGGVWVTGDVISHQRMNQKTFLVDTGANINAATTYAGMPAYCTTTGSGLTADHLYIRNSANNAWNDVGSIITLTSSQVTSALGFTPENAANKDAASGYAGLDASSLLKENGPASFKAGGNQVETQNNKNVSNGYPGLNASGLISSAQIPLFYGDGGDGSVTISSGTVLSRDMQYAALTVNGGQTLNTAGNIVRVNGTLTNAGTITDATNIISGAAGGAINSGNGTASTSSNVTKNGFQNGANGGGGGGGGGSGAAGVSGGAGGNGGNGGGIVIVYCKTINNSGSINANATNGAAGAAGGTPTTGAGCGGGGGGDGGGPGSCKVVYNATTGSGLGSVTATNGTGGTGGGGGNHGTNNQGSNSSGAGGGNAGNGTAGGAGGGNGVAGSNGSNGSGGGGGGTNAGTVGTTGGNGGNGVNGPGGLLIIDNV